MNMVSMLMNQVALSTGEGSAAPINEQQIPQYEQPFKLVLARLIEPNQINFPVHGEGQGHPSIIFQQQLFQLFSSVDELTHEELTLITMEPSLVSDNQAADVLQEVDTEKINELIHYLEDFLQDMEKDNLTVEELYSLFAAIPEIPVMPQFREAGVITANGDGNSLAHLLITAEDGQADSEHWVRWNLLLQQVQHALQDKTISPEAQQVTRLLLSLVNQWNQHPEWLAVLQQKIGQTLTDVESSFSQSHVRREQPVFLQLPPLSLFHQMKETSSLEKSSSVQPLSNHSLPSLEAQTQTKQINMPAFPGEMKEMTLDGLDRPIATSKPGESTPTPTARLAYLLEDMQAILRKQISVLKDGEMTQLRVRLKPEHLGQLDIRIISENGKVTAQIMTSTMLAKEVLELQLYQLRAALTQQGIQIERMEVSQQSANSPTPFEQEERGAKHDQQQKGKRSSQQVNYVDGEEMDVNDAYLYEQPSQINYAV